MFDKLQLKKALFIITFLGTLSLSAQNVTVRRGAKRKTAKVEKQNLSRRAINQALNLKENAEHRRWEKVIYRFLDLNQAENAALYYSNKGKDNLFAQIFKLLNSKELKAYEYLDGVELYDEEHQLDFKAFLERFQIPYKVGGRGANQSIEIEDNDVPSSEVKAYYIKEVWYFDQAKSEFDVSIEAVCPIMFASGDYGDLTYPLFWLPYDELRPYINTNLVMLNDCNNLAEASLDDFFTMRMYKGDIVKVKNLLNKSLIQQVGLDSIKARRDSIEQELKLIQSKAFATPPTMKLKAGEESKDNSSSEELDKKNSRDKRIKKGEKAKKDKVRKVSKRKKNKTKRAKQSKRSSSKSVRGRF